MGKISFDTLNRFAEKIMYKKSIDSFLEALIDGVVDIFDAERATFYFYNEETLELWSYMATDLEISRVRVSLGKGIVGKACKERRIINVKEAHKCRFFDAEVDKKTKFYTRSILAAPLLNQYGTLLGAIQILNKKDGYFSKEESVFFKCMCSYIVIALENTLFLQEKEILLRSTIYALTGAIDAKDPVTVGHSYRVAYYSLKIARAMRLTEKDINKLEYASYLHDVGKIGISDTVLQKKERLSPDEYSIMKNHPAHTKQILKNILFSRENQDIPEIAASHHEFMDGSGYPCGLEGKQINILSRIIAVADIYDALTAFDRPYKKHLSVKKAKAILKKEADEKHLDKKIVNIFIKNDLYHYEQRRHQRIDLNIGIDYQVIPQARVFKEKIAHILQPTLADLEIIKLSSVTSKNISGNGVFIFLKQYLPIGTYLDLQVEIPGWMLRCIGKVVWIQKEAALNSYKAGVSFLNISEKLKDDLERRIERLS